MDLLTYALYNFYRAAQRRYPQVLFLGDSSHPEIALTFDDGPHPQDTPRLLEVLEKHHVRATFHLVGKHAERNPELVQDIHQCGHQLALHCYRHVPFPLENPARLRAGLEQARQRIAEACGFAPQSIRDLRTPYGIFTSTTLALLALWGFRLVMWSCIPPHWMQPVAWSVRQVTESTLPGAVIVLHDGNGHGKRVAEIVDAVIPRIQSMGLGFVTVDEMQKRRSHNATEPGFFPKGD